MTVDIKDEIFMPVIHAIVETHSFFVIKKMLSNFNLSKMYYDKFKHQIMVQDIAIQVYWPL